MSASWKFRVTFAVVLTIAAIIAVLPTFYPVDPKHPETWPDWYTSLTEAVPARITPGLDLQGGLHLQYQVDIDKAVTDKLDRYGDQIERAIKKEHPDAQFTVRRPENAKALEVTAVGADAATLLPADTVALLHLQQSAAPGGQVLLQLDPTYVLNVRATALNQAIETIRKRIDALGVAEPSISRRGDSDIVVQLPGLSEAQFNQAKDLIGQTAQLEFRIQADEDSSFWSTVQIPPTAEGVTMKQGRPGSPDLGKLKAALSAVTPPANTVIRYQRREDFNAALGKLELKDYTPVLLRAEVPLTGESITNAVVSVDPQTSAPLVQLTLDGTGAKIFGDLTAANVHKGLAVVLDEVVASIANINERIPGGRVQITMGGNSGQQAAAAHAQALTIVLRNGALPAPIERQFESQVGPSLGAESVAAGQLALAIGFVLVCGFMIAYYGLSGVIATLSVVLLLLLILATMALLGATMTLPGIAGITLTLGMAVDANVIIYERIREELAKGKSVQAAVSAGFEMAMAAIVDGNITTAIAGVVMLQYGSGPIKGFAVTLLIGIGATLYACVAVTRLFFEYLAEGRRVGRLSI